MKISVATVVLASDYGYKKCNGKALSRTRVIKKGITTTRRAISGKPGFVSLTVHINDRQFSGKMKGVLDPNTGSVQFDVVSQTPTSYLKKKRFAIAGYTLSVTASNISRRGQR